MTYTPTLVSALSPTNFLPIPKTAFSNVTWKLTITDGTPTLYDIDAGSDVVGLVTWPADVIGAYAKAITGGFTRRKGDLDAEAGYLKALSELAVRQVAAEACRVAVNGGDADQIKAACQ